MKYCQKCGAELKDEDTFCPKCGHNTQAEVKAEVVSKPARRRDDSLMVVAEVFCIICTVLAGFAIIPLCWMIPLTVALHNRIQDKAPISVGLKVCILLFVSLISGILLLVGDENE